MEHWKSLGETVPGTLVTLAVDATRLLSTVDSAHRKLGTYAHTLRVLQASAAATDGQFDGPFPSATLHGAFREAARLHALHAGAAYAYFLYVGRRCALGGVATAEALDPLIGSWLGHRDDALLRTENAKWKLYMAASNARAIEDAVRLFRSFPRGSPDRDAWTSVALRLALNATVSAAMALRDLHQMRGALALELYDAWRILNS